MNPQPLRSCGRIVTLLCICLPIALVFPAHVFATETVTERGDVLRAHTKLELPQSEPPHALAILLPGCLSWHPHHQRWRSQLLAGGYAVLHVNSFSAAGFLERADMQREVCSGRQLSGAERAGDVFAVLAELAQRDDLALDKTVMFGWSHGGWSALEFLQRWQGGLVPPNLNQLPELVGLNVRAAYLFYPYCGIGALKSESYPPETQTLIFHGSSDRITSPAECRQQVDALVTTGAAIQFIPLKRAAHWFDNYAETATFNAEATSKAHATIEASLQELASAR